jgi:hypothetical protein
VEAYIPSPTTPDGEGTSNLAKACKRALTLRQDMILTLDNRGIASESLIEAGRRPLSLGGWEIGEEMGQRCGRYISSVDP